MPVHDWREFSASELLWHYCVLWVSYSYGFCPSNTFCWRSTMQLYNLSSKAYLVNAVLLKIPVLQSYWSTAVSSCRISIAKLLKHSHKLAQLPLSEIVEKSSKSPDWDSCSSERDCVMCNMDTCYLAKKNVEFQTAVSVIQGRGDAAFCVMQTWGMQ